MFVVEVQKYFRRPYVALVPVIVHIFFFFLFKTKDEHKVSHKTIFEHRYVHALAKPAAA